LCHGVSKACLVHARRSTRFAFSPHTPSRPEMGNPPLTKSLRANAVDTSAEAWKPPRQRIRLPPGRYAAEAAAQRAMARLAICGRGPIVLVGTCVLPPATLRQTPLASWVLSGKARERSCSPRRARTGAWFVRNQIGKGHRPFVRGRRSHACREPLHLINPQITAIPLFYTIQIVSGHGTESAYLEHGTANTGHAT
jgi:hypothetical protein